jgi:hypothetical protein
VTRATDPSSASVVNLRTGRKVVDPGRRSLAM